MADKVNWIKMFHFLSAKLQTEEPFQRTRNAICLQGCQIFLGTLYQNGEKYTK
jgi:hypothetical protein